MGPAMLRTAGIVRTLTDLGHDVVDRGDVAPDDLGEAVAAGRKARHPASISAWARALARETYAVLRDGADADRDRRRPQAGDGLDQRRGALRR